MSAGRRLRARRIVVSLLGAGLAVGAASGGLVGLSSTVASAASAEPTMMSLSPPSAARVTAGSESETFTGTVTGQTGDGYPTTGAVKVIASNGSTVCTGSLAAGSGDGAPFTCATSTIGLSAGTYTVHAHYTGGASSTSSFSYTASTSGTQGLRVTSPETSSVTLNPITSPVAHGSEAQTFTGTVTGQPGDGYPLTGSVTVVTSGGTTLCTGSLTAGSGDAANFTCNESTPSKLPAAGSPYVVHAHYEGGTSSTRPYRYGPSTSTSQNLTVVTPTSKTPTVALNPITSPVTHGSEAQTFTGTVTGVSGDGYPKTGAVVVKTSTNVVLCTGSLTAGSGDAANFTCAASTPTKLGVGTYSVHAHYTGGASSNPSYAYAAATSTSQTLTVVTRIAKTPTLSLNRITSPVTYGSEAQTFTGTVAGVSGDGYPQAGAVVVKTSTNVVLCTGSLTAGSGDAANFTCAASTPTKLGVGTYSVYAHYTGGASSNPSYAYAAATSTSQTLTVTSGVATTTTLSLNHTSRTEGAETSEVLSVTVTGKAGDGYPRGTVTVGTTMGATVCSTSTRTTGTTDSSDFSCSPAASALASGVYELTASYSPTATNSSSTSRVTYTKSSSTTEKFTVITRVTTTSTLSLNSASEQSGSEASEVFTVTVAGRIGYGYPKGTVKVKTSGGTVLCTRTSASVLTADAAMYACSPQASALRPGSYTIVATYTPATPSSSTTSISYAASSSNSETFTVTRVATTSTLSLNSASEQSGSEASEVFTVTVTGRSGDGYPKGTVTVKTSGGTVLCTRTSASVLTADTATYTCSPRASALGAGTYTIVATYTPGTSSSSIPSIGYAASSSNSKTLTMTARPVVRIYGATPDATAAEELESVYPGTRDRCPGTKSSRPVVLATDDSYPENALVASYLEKFLGTGMLLTPTTSMTSATLVALRVEGITEVYVVGGPSAVSTSVVSEIEHTYAYDCGGRTRSPSHVRVFRIYGATEYTTAEDIAETPNPGFVRSVNLQGAYRLYNDTSGQSSAAPPAGARRTAILASGAEFQDAEASATLAYAERLPLLLTTPTSLSAQALSAIRTLKITQVILMGGPLAVTNAVVRALVAHKVSVIRVAGTDYTDTAARLASMELGPSNGHRGFGWSPTRGVTVARGDFYSDALAGAIVAAHGGATNSGPEPLLLTESPTSVGHYLTSFLGEAGRQGIDDDGTRVTSLTVLGGPLALTTVVVNAMKADL